jgi:retron-type reverse transcriptase
MDNKFLDLITLFLKSGVMVEEKLVPTVKGVPQGGIISPLLYLPLWLVLGRLYTSYLPL